MTFVTSSKHRSGLLVAIITGGRPKLTERPTRKLVESLRAAGVHDVVWSISSRHVRGYERDENPFAVYDDDWAFEYVRDHWLEEEPPEPGGFFGAVPGREWACREAERRGCWGVLQLDDNIRRLSFIRSTRASQVAAAAEGGAGFHADILSAIALSTNARTVGGQLDSIPDAEFKVARSGFPYSFFVERVGPGREEWFGPFEDDISHSLAYGRRPDGTTAAVAPMIRYQKESKSKSGMRSSYTSTRAKQLQRLNPQSAKIGVRKSTSNGRGNARVFHTMPPGAIRNPLMVTDRELYDRTAERLREATHRWMDIDRSLNLLKARKRAAKAGA